MAVLAMLLLLANPAAAATATMPTSASAKTRGGEWKKKMSFADQMLAGSASRGTAQSLLFPLDVMRTRAQVKGLKCALTPNTFLKGLPPQATLGIPAGALQFAAYESAKDQFAKAKMTGALPEVLSGAIGALAASTFLVPQEVLKQRIQAGIYPNVVSGIKTLMKTEGPKGLYKGYFAQVSRDVPSFALSLMCFAQTKEFFKQCTSRAPDTHENLAIGAFSGMSVAVIMTPVDVVKTRVMTGGAEGGIIKTVATILEKEGAATFMKGVAQRVCYLAPFSAMMLNLFELYGKKIVSAKTGVPVTELK